MKRKSEILFRRRLIIGGADFVFFAFSIVSFVLSILGLIDGDKYSVVYLLLSMVFVLLQAVCTALLEYRSALNGGTLIGGKIAELIYTARACRRH